MFPPKRYKAGPAAPEADSAMAPPVFSSASDGFDGSDVGDHAGSAATAVTDRTDHRPQVRFSLDADEELHDRAQVFAGTQSATVLEQQRRASLNDNAMHGSHVPARGRVSDVHTLSRRPPFDGAPGTPLLGALHAARPVPSSAPPRLPVPDQRDFDDPDVFTFKRPGESRRPAAPPKPRKTPSNSVRFGGRGSRGSAVSTESLLETWVPEGYLLRETLGSGSFSRVMRVACAKTGHEFAVKALSKKGQSDHAELVQARREFAVGRLLSPGESGGHPNIVKYFELHQSLLLSGAHAFGIRMELCGRSLASADLHLRPNDLEQRLIEFLVDASTALLYMHTCGFLHVDVKPANLLLGADGLVKLADFGLTIPIVDAVAGANDRREGDNLYIGSEWYGPSDGLTVRAIGPPSDVFCLGMSMLELATNIRLPGGGFLYQQLRSGQFGQDSETGELRGPVSFVMAHVEGGSGIPLVSVSAWFDDILRRMMARLPADRISLSELLGDPVIQQRVFAGSDDLSARRRHAQQILGEDLISQFQVLSGSPTVTPAVHVRDSSEESAEGDAGGFPLRLSQSDDGAQLPMLQFSQGLDDFDYEETGRESTGSTGMDDEIMGDEWHPAEEADLLGLPPLKFRPGLSAALSPSSSPIDSPFSSRRF